MICRPPQQRPEQKNVTFLDLQEASSSRLLPAVITISKPLPIRVKVTLYTTTVTHEGESLLWKRLALLVTSLLWKRHVDPGVIRKDRASRFVPVARIGTDIDKVYLGHRSSSFALSKVAHYRSARRLRQLTAIIGGYLRFVRHCGWLAFAMFLKAQQF